MAPKRIPGPRLPSRSAHAIPIATNTAARTARRRGVARAMENLPPARARGSAPDTHVRSVRMSGTTRSSRPSPRARSTTSGAPRDARRDSGARPAGPVPSHPGFRLDVLELRGPRPSGSSSFGTRAPGRRRPSESALDGAGRCPDGRTPGRLPTASPVGRRDTKKGRVPGGSTPAPRRGARSSGLPGDTGTGQESRRPDLRTTLVDRPGSPHARQELAVARRDTVPRQSDRTVRPDRPTGHWPARRRKRDEADTPRPPPSDGVPAD